MSPIQNIVISKVSPTLSRTVHGSLIRKGFCQIFLEIYLLFCLLICHVYTSVCRNQKCLADPQKLNLQAVVSHPTRLMKSDLRSFARAASTVTEEFPTSAGLICISIIQKLTQVLPGTRSLRVILAPGSQGREDQEFTVICAYTRSPSHPPPTDRRAVI